MNLFLEINNYCNAGCIFCVADRGGIYPRSELEYKTIEKILDKHNIGIGDAVFVTGGEPLIHPEIVEILEGISKRGAYSCATVFGVTLEDEEFCRRILRTGINRLAIPMYGSEDKIHDFVTKVNGSFRSLHRGIENALEIRKEVNARTKIEIRTLACKANYMDIPNIVKHVISNFDINIFGISGLQVSARALKWEKDAVIRIKEVAPPVREALKILKANLVKTVLTNLPLCILGSEYEEFYTGKISERANGQPDSEKTRIKVGLFPHIGYGPWMTEADGIERKSTSKKKGEQCKDCYFYGQCSGIDRRYADRFGFDDLIPMT